jgi:hypothetical protein
MKNLAKIEYEITEEDNEVQIKCTCDGAFSIVIFEACEKALKESKEKFKAQLTLPTIDKFLEELRDYFAKKDKF